MRKKIWFLLVVVACILSISLQTVAADVSVSNEMVKVVARSPVVKGADIVLNNVAHIPELGYTIITREISDTTSDFPEYSINGEPDQQAIKTFSHNIYDRNNDLIVTCYVTVTGTWSNVHNWPEINYISAIIRGPSSIYATYSYGLSGDNADFYLYLNRAPQCYITYRIYSNGNIQPIAEGPLVW